MHAKLIGAAVVICRPPQNRVLLYYKYVLHDVVSRMNRWCLIQHLSRLEQHKRNAEINNSTHARTHARTQKKCTNTVMCKHKPTAGRLHAVRELIKRVWNIIVVD